MVIMQYNAVKIVLLYTHVATVCNFGLILAIIVIIVMKVWIIVT